MVRLRAEGAGERRVEAVRPRSQEKGSSGLGERSQPGPLWPLVSSQEVIQKFLQNAAGPAGLTPSA